MPMTAMPTCVLAIVHGGRDDLAGEIGKAVREAAMRVLSQENLIETAGRVPDFVSGSQVVVIYAGSPAGAQDPATGMEIHKALANGFPVLPVIRASDEGSVRDSLPAQIAHLNAVDRDRDRAFAVATVMRMLGLVEDERRLFLSYVRRDTSDVAGQLHRALQERQFDVFLDRFPVPPGDDFQRRLTEDLADKALMLLLESDGVRDSPWVQHETSCALTHRIGVLAVTMPNVAADREAPVEEAFRFRLSSEDLDCDGLMPGALDALLERIEFSHARALRRRREQLLGSLVDHLEAAGCSCGPLADWTIEAAAAGRVPAVFRVTPRRPRIEDLYALAQERERARSFGGSADMGASLVHDVAHMPADQAELLSWAGSPRNLSIGRLLDSRLEVAA